MKAAAFIAVLTGLALVANPAEAQVPGTDVEGMTVTATTVDGAGDERGTTTAPVAGIGGGLFEARPPDPLSAFGFNAVVQYCDPLFLVDCNGFAPFPMPGGTWTASAYSWGVSRLIFDASASGIKFTGTASWLSQWGETPLDYGSFTFLNAVTGGFSKLQIDFLFFGEPYLGGEAPFDLGMETHDYGSTIPEPSTWVLMLTGVLAIGAVSWRRREKAQAV